jgi:hypothetical protein
VVFRAVCLGLLQSIACPLFAADYLSLKLGDINNDVWHARGVSLQIKLDSSSDEFMISAEEIVHPVLSSPIKSFQFHCTQGSVTDKQIQCKKGSADLTVSNVEYRKINLSFNINIYEQLYDISANNIKIVDGIFSGQFRSTKGRWQLNTKGRGIQLAKLNTLSPALAIPLQQYSVQAKVDLTCAVQGTLTQVAVADWKLKFKELSFADETAEYLGEGLNGEWLGDARLKAGSWSGAQHLTLNKGEILTPFFYLPASNQAVDLSMDLDYQPKANTLSLAAVNFRQGDFFSFTGSTVFDLADSLQILSTEITSTPVQLSTLFTRYLLPVVTNPLLEDIELAGEVDVTLKHSRDKTEILLGINHVYLEQGLQSTEKGSGQFALYDLNGRLNWADQAAEESQISWQGGHLFGGITLGPSQLPLNISGKNIVLAKSSAIPILDGKLQAEQFELTQGEKGPKIRFQGYLTPITMEAISTAIGWPLLSGQLSGMIPGIAYEDGVIAVEGLALVKIFDGDILIKQLKLEDLFGSLPALTANLEMKNIDLETLTRTFSFGKITGKLAGNVDGLRLENWEPVAFEAKFETPVDDESRHRINQKAVDNISNLGGAGVSGAISRSFLRFFEEFGYDRIGISCRLENGVCNMGGIESTEKGYYLVKGGGIPRIDIMGFNRRTDWSVLVSKLKQISAGSAPVIE